MLFYLRFAPLQNRIWLDYLRTKTKNVNFFLISVVFWHEYSLPLNWMGNYGLHKTQKQISNFEVSRLFRFIVLAFFLSCKFNQPWPTFYYCIIDIIIFVRIDLISLWLIKFSEYHWANMFFIRMGVFLRAKIQLNTTFFHYHYHCYHNCRHHHHLSHHHYHRLSYHHHCHYHISHHRHHHPLTLASLAFSWAADFTNLAASVPWVLISTSSLRNSI